MTAALPPGPGYRSGEPGGWSTQRLTAAARRQAPWIAATAVLVMALTLVLTLRQRPIYEARATIRIEDRPAQERDLLSALTAPSTIETEVEILKSRSVAEDVVDSLDLNVRITAPEGLTPALVFDGIHAREAVPGTYLVRREEGDGEITAPDGARAGGAHGDTLRVARLTAVLRPPPGLPDQMEVAVVPTTGAANALRRGLRVARTQANAAIVSVAYEGLDPALARDVVNAVARSYVARRNQMQKRQARAAVDFLDGQVAAIGGELTTAEAALEAFRRRALVVDPEAQATEQVRRYAELRARRDELAAQQGTLEEMVRQAQGGDQPAGGWTAYAAAPALVANETMSGLVQQLSELETERSRLLARRTEADPDVASLTETIALLAARLGRLASEQRRVLDQNLRATDSALARANLELSGVPAAELEFARRKRQVDLMGELYTLLQTRLKESEISEAVEIANIQVVDSAVTPGYPVRPRKMMNLLFGTAGGLLLGLVVALLRETGDTRVRSRDEVLEITGAPLLATVPRLSTADGRLLKPAERVEKRLVVRNAPRSPAAEAYRALRTNIAFSGLARDHPLKTLVVTSAEPQDGKSTTAVNLAVTLAEQGLHVALVEADLRRPVLHRVFHVDRHPGITDLVMGTVRIEDVARRVPLAGHAHGSLDFFPGGTSVPNPAELAGAPATRAVLDQLAGRYQAVVLDTPPLSVVTDPAVAGTLADGVILVARMGATHREALRRAVEELRGVGARILGTVLTDVHETEDRYGYRYSYTYYGDEDGEGDGAR